MAETGAAADAARQAEALEAELGGVARGDRDALRRLYDACAGAVHAVVLSILHDPHAAEDAVQDTFLKIWDGAGSYRPGGRPMAWVLTVAHNAALDCLRRSLRESVGVDDSLADGAPPVEALAEERLRLHRALAALPGEDREIIVLRVLGGLRYREVCAILHIPPGTAAWKYARGIRRLRELLSE